MSLAALSTRRVASAVLLLVRAFPVIIGSIGLDQRLGQCWPLGITGLSSGRTMKRQIQARMTQLKPRLSTSHIAGTQRRALESPERNLLQ